MDIKNLLREKRKMERLVASAAYEFELATEFQARVHSVNIHRRKPEGSPGDLLHAMAHVTLADGIEITNAVIGNSGSYPDD